ncbi:MAG: type III-B CRISPR module RAMP protein Cmr4, partial [Candidatus Sericytochromatia bacterium]|nr:type III-B CRISPR module RAMP protein Cmr4 [Candidatus Tanganyikabacteria bacterium]
TSLVLEAFEYRAVADPQVRLVADWLADVAFPDTQSFKYFKEKLREDLVVLPEGDFGHFVRHSTVVEPHVRIDDDTGTAADTGLFYTENLPPESILAGLGLASVERTRGRNGEGRWLAEEVLERVLAGNGNGLPGIAGGIVQMGGDATTGRGLVVVQPASR